MKSIGTGTKNEVKVHTSFGIESWVRLFLQKRKVQSTYLSMEQLVVDKCVGYDCTTWSVIQVNIKSGANCLKHPHVQWTILEHLFL